MIRSVLLKKGYTRESVKQLVAYLIKRNGANKAWKIRHNKVFHRSPDYKKVCDSEMEKNHTGYWSHLQKRVKLQTLRICKNISGITHPQIVPEEIYDVDIEPTLNRGCIPDFQTHKSFYNKWHDPGLFPKDLMHVISGEVLDAKLNPIDLKEMELIAKNLTFPVIVKPNDDTRGGKNVHVVKSSEQLIRIIGQKDNVIVQEFIEQHPEMDKYHSGSLNTVRVDIYKSVADHQFHFLHAALRMGIGGSLDNLSSGGIVSYINEGGKLHGYALDKYGKKYLKHPDSKMPFSGIIPEFRSLINVSMKVAANVYMLRTFALDLCFDKNGTWRVIEINPANSIRFAQYAGRPFYGKFTDEVIDYCKKNHWVLS